ncbi:hypothetical protein [Mesorhizobium sp. NBSH29]|uniref:hypothetical protein n=1 Tax=Mesorhizobium sp. NBSH29 TaxID=2654249 RepID=UPI00189670A1|nr:hypothetical protein [Mesorhizobium sp. NBSH29]
MAWHIAYLSAYAPEKPKNFTKLKNLLQSDKSAKIAKPDWQRDFASFSAWAGSFKGK